LKAVGFVISAMIVIINSLMVFMKSLELHGQAVYKWAVNGNLTEVPITAEDLMQCPSLWVTALNICQNLHYACYVARQSERIKHFRPVIW